MFSGCAGFFQFTELTFCRFLYIYRTRTAALASLKTKCLAARPDSRVCAHSHTTGTHNTARPQTSDFTTQKSRPIAGTAASERGLDLLVSEKVQYHTSEKVQYPVHSPHTTPVLLLLFCTRGVKSLREPPSVAPTRPRPALAPRSLRGPAPARASCTALHPSRPHCAAAGPHAAAGLGGGSGGVPVQAATCTHAQASARVGGPRAAGARRGSTRWYLRGARALAGSERLEQPESEESTARVTARAEGDSEGDGGESRGARAAATEAAAMAQRSWLSGPKGLLDVWGGSGGPRLEDTGFLPVNWKKNFKVSPERSSEGRWPPYAVG